MKDDDRVTTVQAGRILGVETREVYELVDRGELVGFRADGYLLLDRGEVEALAAR